MPTYLGLADPAWSLPTLFKSGMPHQSDILICWLAPRPSSLWWGGLARWDNETKAWKIGAKSTGKLWLFALATTVKGRFCSQLHLVTSCSVGSFDLLSSTRAYSFIGSTQVVTSGPLFSSWISVGSPHFHQTSNEVGARSLPSGTSMACLSRSCLKGSCENLSGLSGPFSGSYWDIGWPELPLAYLRYHY